MNLLLFFSNCQPRYSFDSKCWIMVQNFCITWWSSILSATTGIAHGHHRDDGVFWRLKAWRLYVREWWGGLGKRTPERAASAGSMVRMYGQGFDGRSPWSFFTLVALGTSWASKEGDKIAPPLLAYPTVNIPSLTMVRVFIKTWGILSLVWRVVNHWIVTKSFLAALWPAVRTFLSSLYVGHLTPRCLKTRKRTTQR